MPTRSDSPTRTCTAPGCARALRARGLCSTHYNQSHQPQRHSAVIQPCAGCGRPVRRARRSSRRPCCSVACRTIVQHGAPPRANAYTWAKDAARRAAIAGATEIHLIERDTVLDRDQWICQTCRIVMDEHADPFDPKSPTIDHVVPLSRGGQHTLANLQALCLRCNSRKRDAL